MQYDLSKALDRERFKVRANALFAKGVCVELTEKSFRTTSQNSYLHVLIGLVALETGNTIEDTKRCYFKEEVNADLFRVRKTDRLGYTINTLRSSAELTKEEMSIAIDRFKRWGAENGIYMPSPEDEAILRDIMIEMGRQKQYL